jgi:hypothetical protein
MERTIKVETKAGKWTRFYDMCSGGREKTDYSTIYIEAGEKEAIELFEREFGRDPRNTTCHCCGPDFGIDEYDGFEAATEHDTIGPKSLVLRVERVTV